MAAAVLREALLAAQLLVQVAMLAVIEHNINILGVIEVPMQTDNVRVVQSPLNFEFTLHLRKEVKLL